MIRVERKKTEKSEAAIKALVRAKLHDSGHNQPEVNVALKEMFYGKCYICENKQITSYQIEHLKPYKGNLDLRYDWNNLFLSCAHCNNTKLGKYDPILDCTVYDVDRMIAFRKKGYFGHNEGLEFEIINDTDEVRNTVALLYDVFSGKTEQKKMEAKNLRRHLRNVMTDFKKYIREYLESDEEEKEDYLCKIKQELNERAEFIAFKRWLLRDNQAVLEELINQLKNAGVDTI